MTLISMLWLLSDRSQSALTALWLISEPERYRLRALDKFEPNKRTNEGCTFSTPFILFRNQTANWHYLHQCNNLSKCPPLWKLQFKINPCKEYSWDCYWTDGDANYCFLLRPPHNDPDTNFVREAGPSMTSEPINLQIGRIKTTLKVKMKHLWIREPQYCYHCAFFSCWLCAAWWD